MKTVRLADVAQVNPRGQKPADDEDVSFVPMADLDETTARTGRGTTRQFRDVSKGYTVFQDRDLLIAKITPCFENNKIGQAQLAHSTGVGSTEFHVVRPDPQVADARYLLHYLRQDRIRVQGEKRMTGSAGQRRVPTAFLSELKIPLPSLTEQRRTAEILDQAESLRVAQLRTIAELDALAGSLFPSVFADHRDADVRPLSELAEVTSGLTKGRKLTGQKTRPVPYLAVSNVQAGFLKLDAVKEIDATDGEIQRLALRDGDLLLTEGGDPDKLGRGTLWRNELPLALHQNHIFRVRPRADSGISPTYLAAFVGSRDARSYFLKAAKQTTGIASINKTQLGALPVPVAAASLQRWFEDRLTTVRRLHELAASQASLQNELVSTLRQRAFRGEL